MGIIAMGRPQNPQDLIAILFIEKSEHGFIQLFRYLFVGGFSAVADISTLYIGTSVLHINYLVSAVLAFVVGTIVNYLLSILWVFKSSGNLKKEISLFTLIGLGGLSLNELILWILHGHLGLNILIAKLISVWIVVIWSFSLRRLLFARLPQKSRAVDIV